MGDSANRLMSNKAIRSIALGGLIAGVLDITDALVFFGMHGVPASRLLQSIASGLLGASSFRGGWRTAMLGLALHFLIAFAAAAIYYIASQSLRILRVHPIVSGLVYGGAVYLFMNYVVIPLSAGAPSKRPPSLPSLINGVLAVVLLVGLPIALVNQYRAKSMDENWN